MPRSTTHTILDMATDEEEVRATMTLGERIEAAGIESTDDLRRRIQALRAEMRAAADDLDFERAAELRDQAKKLEELELALR